MSNYVQKPDEFIIEKVIKCAYNEIELETIRNSGYIFGGFVRDEIRGVLPNDIDISFKTLANTNNFIKAIRSKKEFNKIIMKTFNSSEKYSINKNIHSIKTLIITIVIGAIPFIYTGLDVNISIDIVIIKPNINIEPPFNNLDMLCNSFIKTKEGIRLSRHTGKKILDNLSDSEQIIIAAEIINLIRKSETYLCFGHITDQNIVLEIALKRLLKLKDRFTFLNLPFGIELYNKEGCCIEYCDTKYTKETHIAYTLFPFNKNNNTSKKAFYCLNCLINHLNSKIKLQEGTEFKDNLIFKCPLNNNIDFSICEKKFNKFILELLSMHNINLKLEILPELISTEA